MVPSLSPSTVPTSAYSASRSASSTVRALWRECCIPTLQSCPAVTETHSGQVMWRDRWRNAWRESREGRTSQVASDFSEARRSAEDQEPRSIRPASKTARMVGALRPEFWSAPVIAASCWEVMVRHISTAPSILSQSVEKELVRYSRASSRPAKRGAR